MLPEDELLFALEDVEIVDLIETIVSLDESLVNLGRDDIKPTSSPRRFEQNVHVLLIIYLLQNGNVMGGGKFRSSRSVYRQSRLSQCLTLVRCSESHEIKDISVHRLGRGNSEPGSSISDPEEETILASTKI